MVYKRKVSVYYIHEGCVQQSYINVILPLTTRNELLLSSISLVRSKKKDLKYYTVNISYRAYC